MSDDEALEAILKVIRVFEGLGVDYLVGGSLASSFHGIPRSTLDADIVADLRPEHVDSSVCSKSVEMDWTWIT